MEGGQEGEVETGRTGRGFQNYEPVWDGWEERGWSPCVGVGELPEYNGQTQLESLWIGTDLDAQDPFQW